MHSDNSTKYRLTKFQKEVYRVVSQIPIGQVRSYSWVARKIRRPKAVRAVGSALKNNPFAPIIPCHRVVSSDGALGGYSRGLKKKKQLLKLEEQIADFMFTPHLRGGNIRMDTPDVCPTVRRASVGRKRRRHGN